MKTKLISMLLIMSVILSCRKDQQSITSNPTIKNSDSVKSLSLAEIKDWYGKNVSDTSSQKNLNAVTAINGKTTFSLSSLPFSWDKIQSFTNKKGNYWLTYLGGQPTFQNVKQGYRKLAFIRDSTGQIQARILEIIPDGLYYQRKQKAETKDFTGRVFIYDASYHLLSGNVYSGGKQIGRIKPQTLSTTSSNVRTLEVQVSQDCQWNDSNYIDAEGVFTVYSEYDCTYTIYDDGFYPDVSGGGGSSTGDPLGGGGGGGGDSSSAPAVSNLPGEFNPTIDPKAFMNCFGTIADAGATMSITVYVQEPWPGTSFNIGPNSVGHTAIGLSKSGGGSTITQVVGFYPNATGYSKIHAPSKVSSNGGDLQYNASITYNVSATQFSQIANYIANPPGTYDLSSFNCTDFVIGACQSGNISLPNASSIVGFNGATLSPEYSNTPAGLGTSLRNMQGKPGVSNSDGTTPNSHGPCN
jgi:hypothetical protein